MVSQLGESDAHLVQLKYNSLALSESRSRQKFRGILGLSNVKSINEISDFKTQEVDEMSKIFYLKLLTKKIFEFLNAIEVIISYDHIIHIQETQNSAFLDAMKK